ncbi:HelD family protein [Phytoactinopolyspora mesophila]|uniref:AAA family ATPase n=1 Tax=Phytoactinopolyspora mesophila TaxID=2650750 RepID=A0A7K3M603_9ACTN|nr:DNA/RNA helicase domain-containing protein [Phytoactinopolyspora mesophila]NDL58675.1 AAA family ATPase [Phytoactinopolyspora mesophila]
MKKEIEAEQAYVSVVYERFDALRDGSYQHFVDGIGAEQSPTHQAKLERDVAAQHHSSRAARLSAAEHGLVLGRLDVDDDAPLYIGRAGIYDEEYDPLLVDWRAPAAIPFYRATPAERLGVRRRRHIHLKGRSVIRLDDDLLALDELGEDEIKHLTGEAALLTSLKSARTGRMADIVATIQAEQDRVIRSGSEGILVVEGGPGTGKTVVALHRAAYLLYTHRERLSKNGVLVVGPNATFVRYIDQVLPGLGETDVVLASMGELYPGVATSRPDTEAAAVVKGDLRMAAVLEQAVRNNERAPIGGMKVVTDRDTYVLDDQTCRRIRDEAQELARRAQQPHNRMRRFVVRAVLEELTSQALTAIESVLDGVEAPDENEDEVDQELSGLIDRDALHQELRSSPGVREALDVLWPELTPEGLLGDLLTDPVLRADVAPQLSVDERNAVQRADRGSWTVADVPLLDEIATLVGELDATLDRLAGQRMLAEMERSRHTEEERQLVSDAYDVAMDMAIDEEVAMPVDAELVLSRYHDTGPDATLSQRARRDREWRYGHVIVDEAQELSPMAWRLLLRRCPTLSMTVVGDIAQTSAPDGVTSWAEVLDPLAAGRWRRARLTVNYRSTEAIMAVASDVLAAGGSDGAAPRAVREGGDLPWSWCVAPDQLATVLPEIATRELAALGEGTLAFVVPVSLLARSMAAIKPYHPGARGAGDPDMLDAQVAVLTSEQAKGLEFDAAIVVAPDEIIADSPRGYSDLYVALTRPTRRLGVVYSGELPAGLSRLDPVGEYRPSA